MKINISQIVMLGALPANLSGVAAFVIPDLKVSKGSHQTHARYSHALYSSYLRNLDGEGFSEKGSSNVREVTLNGDVLAGKPPMASSSISTTGGSSSGSAGAKTPNPAPKTADTQSVKNIWAMSSPILVQGGSLRTWSVADPFVERVQVLMSTDGRPLNANVELWHGPDNTPQKLRVYVEDGSLRRFCAVIETPLGHNAIAIRNTGHLEFPLAACVNTGVDDSTASGASVLKSISKGEVAKPRIIQGGAVHTYPFAPAVSSVQVLLKTDGRPLNARIELMQGPNNNKQVMEVYTEDGRDRPFFAIIETPGIGNVVRIVNTATIEFPMSASVEPYLVESASDGAGLNWSDDSANNFIMGN